MDGGVWTSSTLEPQTFMFLDVKKLTCAVVEDYLHACSTEELYLSIYIDADNNCTHVSI